MTTQSEQRDWARLTAWLDTDRDALSDDAEGRKALARAGWDSKAGILHAPTSSGELVPMWPEAVLFGDQVGQFEERARLSMQPSYKSVFGKYLRSLARLRSEDNAYAMLEPFEQKALNEGQDDAGGFLVPADVSAELLARVAQRAVIRPYATVVPTNRDLLPIPRIVEHTTSGSTYASAFVGGWAGETPTFTDTDAVFGRLEIPIKKIRVGTRLSSDFVADSAVDVLAWLARNGGDNMAKVEDDGFLAGTGAGLQPSGILTSTITTVDVEGSTVNTISNTTAATGSAPKIITLSYTLPSQYSRAARWVMRRGIEGDVRALVNGQGGLMFPPGDTGTLLGKPVEHSDAMPDDGTDAAKVIVFGDLSSYVVAQRTEITVRVLRERFADLDQVGFLLSERVGGALFNPDGLRVGIV